MDPVLIERDNVARHFKGAAQRVAADLVGEYAPNANAEQEILSAGGAVHRGAAAEKDSLVPAGMAEYVYRADGRQLGQQRRRRQATEESNSKTILHLQ